MIPSFGRAGRQRAILTRAIYVLIAILTVVVAGSVSGTWASSRAALAQEGEVQPAEVDKLVPLQGIQQVVAGGFHTCAIMVGGGVKCWGNDFYGQVGDGGSNTNAGTPVDVVGLESGVTQLALGENHSCALKSDGSVWCWGRDDMGQLGDDVVIADKNVPVPASGLGSGVAAIGAGRVHTCAVMQNGSVRCWGSDANGQIGDGPGSAGGPLPIPLLTLASGVRSIVGGYAHTCALLASGVVKCWGNDEFGQLGAGIGDQSSQTPIDVVNLANVDSIAAGGAFNCAHTTASAVYCWGDNSTGQLGFGSFGGFMPSPLETFLFGGPISGVAAGFGHSCLKLEDGAVRCTGGDINGQIGNGAPQENVAFFSEVIGLAGQARSITGGYAHTCATLEDGTAQCWGSDQALGLGNGAGYVGTTMPGYVVVPKTCFELTTSSNGTGSPPVFNPGHSQGCPIAHFLAGAQLSLLASPAANNRVDFWFAPAQGAPGQTVASLTMPAEDTTVFMSYAACNMLTVSHTGSGSNPIPAPSSSMGCPIGRYALGETVVVSVVPAANNRVKSWSGTTASPAVGSQVNSFSMPLGAHTVSVAYEPCFTLTLSVSGQGAPLSLSPAASDGCLTGGFAVGQPISLLANAAAGWRIAGWTGTQNDASTATTNSATMPAANKSISVRYEQIVSEQPTATPTPTPTPTATATATAIQQPGVTETPVAPTYNSYLPSIRR